MYNFFFFFFKVVEALRTLQKVKFQISKSEECKLSNQIYIDFILR